MGCGQAIKRSVIYFNVNNNYNVNPTDIKSLENTYDSYYLNFSLNNCRPNTVYYITLSNCIEYNSDRIKTNKNETEVKFKEMLICDFIYNKEQKIEISLYKKTKDEPEKKIIICTTLKEIVLRDNSIYKHCENGEEELNIESHKMHQPNAMMQLTFKIKVNNNFDLSKNSNKLYFKIFTNYRRLLFESGLNEDDGSFKTIKIPYALLIPSFIIKFFNIDDNCISEVYGSKEFFCKEKINEEVKNVKVIEINKNKSDIYEIYSDSILQIKYNFIDYLKAGVHINLSVGIDFTGSNGNPFDEGSLHYLYNDGRKNDYEKSIEALVKFWRFMILHKIYLHMDSEQK